MCMVFSTYHKHHLVLLKQVGKANRFDVSHVTVLVTEGECMELCERILLHLLLDSVAQNECRAVT